MKIDCIVAEIGSTTTVVNAFDGIHSNRPRFLGQGMASTSVTEGDVTIGLLQAIDALKQTLNSKELEISQTFATSSAAGGLRMSVHGLVYDMTAKAAKEAALGAGANVHMVTAGKLTTYDLEKIIALNPNIIMIAGGVDFGERETALFNASQIASLKLRIPVIYAGNIVNHEEVKKIFQVNQLQEYLHITENVYPKIDVLNVEPSRKIIQQVFETHIIHAPGMEKIKQMVDGNIIPTPGAVMNSAILLESMIGDLVVIDVGGATTDVHSVTSGSVEVSKILINPEPNAKRTVEGDLGVYINRQNIIDLIGVKEIMKQLSISKEELYLLLEDYKPIPNKNQVSLVECLTKAAVVEGVIRHAGKYMSIYATMGKTKVAEGKDLTSVKYVIGTGGALTRLPNRKEILKELLHNQDGLRLVPPPHANILIDQDYIMASLGVLLLQYPNQVKQLLIQSLKLEGELCIQES